MSWGSVVPVSTEWVPSSRLSEWYRPVDFCMLQAPALPKRTSLQDFREGNCSTRGRILRSFCGPGMAARGPCIPPLAHRKGFFQSLRGLDDPLARPVAELAHLLAQQDRALVLAGDSVMLQVRDALLCEASREGLSIRWDAFADAQSKTRHVDAKCHMRYPLSVPQGSGSGSSPHHTATFAAGTGARQGDAGVGTAGIARSLLRKETNVTVHVLRFHRVRSVSL